MVEQKSRVGGALVPEGDKSLLIPAICLHMDFTDKAAEAKEIFKVIFGNFG